MTFQLEIVHFWGEIAHFRAFLTENILFSAKVPLSYQLCNFYHTMKININTTDIAVMFKTSKLFSKFPNFWKNDVLWELSFERTMF